MGIFGKERVGVFKAVDASGRRFTWTIPKFSSHTAGATLDSENVVSFNKTKFHLHMSLGKTGDIGVYIHYKKSPIPKYSYYFENSKRGVMRQHTAHTIPEDSERCGHWNVCSYGDMRQFIGEDDMLLVQVVFDNDSLVLDRVAENRLTALWSIPNLATQNLNPYSSSGFYVDSTLLVARLDVKRSGGGGGSETMSSYNYDDVHTYIFFLFCRKGVVPPHSIDLVDASGNSYYRVEESEDGSALTVMVDRTVIHEHVGKEGSLYVRIGFRTSGNPLEAFAALANPGGSEGNGEGHMSNGRNIEENVSKPSYKVVDD